jgi:hypothetical protein
MTNKQLAKLLRETGNSLFDNTYDPNETLLLDEAADRLENQNEWISVEDRLPEVESTAKGWGNHKVQKSVRVLCACKQKSGKVLVKEGYYELLDYSDKPYWRIPGSIDSVTHWMPLPTPPTEKEN